MGFQLPISQLVSWTRISEPSSPSTLDLGSHPRTPGNLNLKPSFLDDCILGVGTTYTGPGCPKKASPKPETLPWNQRVHRSFMKNIFSFWSVWGSHMKKWSAVYKFRNETKKHWLFRVFVGDVISTQLCGDYNETLWGYFLVAKIWIPPILEDGLPGLGDTWFMGPWWSLERPLRIGLFFHPFQMAFP